MDFGLIGGVNPPDPKAGGPMSFETFEPARFAMGDTVRYAERMGLIEMEPRTTSARRAMCLRTRASNTWSFSPNQPRRSR